MSDDRSETGQLNDPDFFRDLGQFSICNCGQFRSRSLDPFAVLLLFDQNILCPDL